MEKAKEILIGAIRSRRERLRIAIQKDGRLSKIAWALLETCMQACGVNLPKRDEQNRALITKPEERPDIEVVLVRNGQIPWLVQSGNAEFGITGEDTVLENTPSLPIAARLGGGRSSMVIQVRTDSKIKKTEDLDGKTFATSYPSILKAYLASRNITPGEILKQPGSVEAFAALGITDAVCDSVESGETMRANDLRPLVTIGTFEAVLIGEK